MQMPVILAEMFEGMEKWPRVKGIEAEHGENQTYDTGQRSP